LFGYTIQAKTEEVGKVHDFYFDDKTWIIRYMVVNTGKWLPGRKVLLIPSVLGQPDWESHVFPVELSKEQIINSPDIDLDKPVSRQQELALHEHFRWVPYWVPPGPAGAGIIPPYSLEKQEQKNKEETDTHVDWDTHLRSANEVIGYHIQASDGEIGHVEDFILEDVLEVIRYMIIDTRNWLPGKKVLISPWWIDKVSWGDTNVYVDLTRDLIKDSPEFDPSQSVNRNYEERLYDFYGRPKYWG
jgi:hypothetical protein